MPVQLRASAALTILDVSDDRLRDWKQRHTLETGRDTTVTNSSDDLRVGRNHAHESHNGQESRLHSGKHLDRGILFKGL